MPSRVTMTAVVASHWGSRRARRARPMGATVTTRISARKIEPIRSRPARTPATVTTRAAQLTSTTTRRGIPLPGAESRPCWRPVVLGTGPDRSSGRRGLVLPLGPSAGSAGISGSFRERRAAARRRYHCQLANDDRRSLGLSLQGGWIGPAPHHPHRVNRRAEPPYPARRVLHPARVRWVHNEPA